MRAHTSGMRRVAGIFVGLWCAGLAVSVTPARAEQGRPALAVDDSDDDPKRDRLGLPLLRGEHATPTVKFSYRRFTIPNLDRTDLGMNAGQIDLYPLSLKWVRIGMEAEFGAGTGRLNAKDSSAWYFATGLTAGFQYPARFTPFVEGRFVAGLIGGDLAGKSVVSYCWMGGIEAGVEAYLSGRLYVSAAFGWMHPFYRGIDYAYSQERPQDEPRYLDFSSDTWTVKVGVGL